MIYFSRSVSLRLIARLQVLSLCALISSSAAFADRVTDAAQEPVGEWVDASRTGHVATQCILQVTSTPTLLSTLWANAGCPTFPTMPQFAFVMPTGGMIYYRTDGVTVSTSNGWPIFQNQAWTVEGRLSVNALQLVAATSISTVAEIRW